MAVRLLIAVGLVAFLFAEPGFAAPTPELGRTALVNTVSGTVLVKERGDDRFTPLSRSPTLVRMDAELDATEGHVRVRTDAGGRRPLSDGEFWQGSFILSQSDRGGGFTNLKLTGGDAGGCAAGAAASRGSSGVKQQRLWGSGKGRFKTKGRNGAGTIRGTTWLTEDLCDVTRTKVKRGVVRTDTNGDLEFRVSEGESVQYHCDSDGKDPVSRGFCTSVYSKGADVGLWGGGLVNLGDATSYDLCVTNPFGVERCEPYPLSEPVGPGDGRDSVVICSADSGPGAYYLRWLIDGVQLGPSLGFVVKTPPSQGCVSVP